MEGKKKKKRKPFTKKKVLHLTKLPGFASFHAELLEPPEEHHENEDELAGIAPPPDEAGPPVGAELVRADLPTATVAHGESHISISADNFDDDAEQVEVEGVFLELLPLRDADGNDEDGEVGEL